jgi:hypothetical protein
MMSAISGAGTAYPPGAPEVTPRVSGVHVIRSLVLCVFCGSLFVLFLLAIVHVLSVDIRILITPLVTSNSSFQEEQCVGGWMGVKTLVKVVAFPWLICHCV